MGNSEYELARLDEMSSQPSCSKWDNETIKTVTDSDDELFLIIDDNHNDNDSGVFISKKEQRLFNKVADDEFNGYRRTSSRRFYCDRNRLLAKNGKVSSCDSFARASSKFEMLHKDLRLKMNSVQELINREQSFLTKIHCHSDTNEDITDNTHMFVNNTSEFCDNNETVIV